ncbi:MAG: hypothetical protein K0Q48_1140 [Bacillota bacterium]|jgi:predicted esterase|nr:hypothetical protein [Bacillota bacterium]
MPNLAKLKKVHNNKMLRIIRKVWAAAGILFFIYLLFSFQAQGVDRVLLASDEHIIVTTLTDRIEFSPQRNLKSSALIFYPGGMVEPKAYVPMARMLAEKGYKVVILKLPFRNAATKAQEKELFSKTIQIINDDSNRLTWILSGHSRGGALAAKFVRDHEGIFEELVLIATTHPKNYSLSDRKIHVTKIYASNDGIADEAQILENRSKLPNDTTFIRIEGGNHSQFGYYGFQVGDHKASIRREDQVQELVKSISEVLDLYK